MLIGKDHDDGVEATELEAKLASAGRPSGRRIAEQMLGAELHLTTTSEIFFVRW